MDTAEILRNNSCKRQDQRKPDVNVDSEDKPYPVHGNQWFSCKVSMRNLNIQSLLFILGKWGSIKSVLIRSKGAVWNLCWSMTVVHCLLRGHKPRKINMCIHRTLVIGKWNTCSLHTSCVSWPQQNLWEWLINKLLVLHRSLRSRTIDIESWAKQRSLLARFEMWQVGIMFHWHCRVHKQGSWHCVWR